MSVHFGDDHPPIVARRFLFECSPIPSNYKVIVLSREWKTAAPLVSNHWPQQQAVKLRRDDDGRALPVTVARPVVDALLKPVASAFTT